jgi:enamine deaminase RidA (YjgF/YER057c/UK114 family)
LASSPEAPECATYQRPRSFFQVVAGSNDGQSRRRTADASFLLVRGAASIAGRMPLPTFDQRRERMTISRIDQGPRMSQAVVHGDTIYLAGQVGAPGESVTAQTTAVLASVDRLLAETGSSKNHLLMATIWLADMQDFAEMNTVWDAWIAGAAAPARATGEAKLATADYKVEVIIIAAKA